ncbi:MAG: hypothetical protein OEM84_06655 [Acidimicrobiia bacterium]|nr:hypothetical protein [Acidimicrobiia bacterium]
MDRLSVLVMFSWQYLLMAFLACLGIVQLAAARSGRRHLWLLRRRRATRLLGVVLVVGGIALFYLLPLWMAGPWGLGQVDGSATWATASLQSLTAARNINDTAGGLSGHWQALWVSLAWIAAVFFARAVGRIGNLTGAEDRPPDQEKRVLADVTAGEQR